jgi:hypothetical protein
LRLAHTVDEGHISSVAEFFQSHGVVVLEYRRGDSPAVVRTLLLELLGKLRSGSLTLSIGQTLPLSPELIEVLSASPLTQD